MKSIFLYFLFLAGTQVNAQILQGVVLDNSNDEPLPYAHVYILGKSLGEVGFRDGTFKIDLSGVNQEDTVKVSYIGFKPTLMKVKELNFDQPIIFRLEAMKYELEDVIVRSRKKIKTIGNHRASRSFTGWGDFESKRGRTRGLLLTEIEDKIKVKSIGFRLHHNDWDSVLFRVDILSLDANGKPGPSILHENIFVTAIRGRNWISKELDEFDIVIHDDVIILIEWLDAWGSSGNSLLTFSLSNSKGYRYDRNAQDQYGRLTYAKDTPSIYLEVYQ